MKSFYFSSCILFHVILISFILLANFTEAKNTHSKSKVKKREISRSTEDLVGNGEGPETFNVENNESKPKITKKTNKKSKSSIELPEHYNKLEVPVFNKKDWIMKEAAKNPNISTEELDLLDELMDNDIDIAPLPLTVYVLVRSIREVDELEEELTVEMDFMTTWMDFVLCLENECFLDGSLEPDSIVQGMKSIDPVFLKEIWKPDLFIENVVSISRPELITKPSKLMFSPLGFITFQTRVSVTIDCEMEFHYYPADTQHCKFSIRSFSHSMKELNISWDLENAKTGVFLEERNEHNFDVKIDSVTTKEITEWEGFIHANYSEKYQVLEFTITVRRKLSYHLIQTYLPSVFFIIITWLCFLVPSTMVEARIGVAMTTLLTLTSMFSSVRESSPIVSYVKAIDIWMVACIFAVFLTLLEFTVLLWLRHKHEENSSDQNKNEESHLPLQRFSKKSDQIESTEFDNLEPLNGSRIKRKDSNKIFVRFLPGAKHLNNKEKVADWIEEKAFLIFSFMFLTFNLSYWSWLFHSSGYFNWEVDPKYNSI